MSLLTLPRLLAAIQAAGVPIIGINSQRLVSPATLQAAAQPTIDAFDDSPAADAAYLVQQSRADASTDYTTGGAGLGLVVRALALVVLDEMNILRTAAGLAPRTAAQLKTAVLNKISSGAADTQ